jgi:hypothetical protein
LLLRLWSPQQGEFLGVGGVVKASSPGPGEKESGRLPELSGERAKQRQLMADLATAWRHAGKKFRLGRAAQAPEAAKDSAQGWPKGGGWPSPWIVHPGAKAAANLLDYLSAAGEGGRHAAVAGGSPVAAQAVEMLMNDASSALRSEVHDLEMPCVCLSDLLAVQEALERFVAALQKGHLESHRAGLAEATGEQQLPEGLQQVKVVGEQGAAPRKLRGLGDELGRLIAQLADFVGEEVRGQVDQAALLARQARPPKNEAEQVVALILAPALESTGRLHTQLVDTVFTQALRSAACCCKSDEDTRRVRDFVQDLQQHTSRTDKKISSMVLGLGLPAI